MTEITVDTFKQAAFEAGERLRGGGTKDEDDDKESLRERIKTILDAGEIIERGSTRDISTRTAERIMQMLWPERSLEIKKKRAEMEVERGAILSYIRDIMNGEA